MWVHNRQQAEEATYDDDII